MSQARDLIAPSDAKPPLFVGIDLGGTNIKIGLIDNAGQSLAFRSIPTKVEEGPEEGCRRMGEAVCQLLGDAQVSADDVARVGLATPGMMDIPNGMLLEPHNLPGWYNFPIRDRVSHHAGKPVTYANDANAAAYGEYWIGAGQRFNSLIFFTLGTGVGGGIIINDFSIDGEHSAGGEVGHIVIDSREDARICPCGRKGHLEAYASATGLIGRVEDALKAGAETSVKKRIEAGEELTPLMIAEEAKRSDKFSHETVMETARYLGVGITTLAHTIDPSGIVLGGAMTFGGGASELGRAFLARVREVFEEYALTPVARGVEIEFASLGSDAGYIGAAGLAHVEHHAAPT